MTDRTVEITALLAAAQDGHEEALAEVMELAYAELRRIARGQMRRRYGRRSDGLTMQPTVLVNEAFLRLIKQRNRYDSRGHFFAIATKAMLRVLMEYDRARGAERRGGDQVRLTLSGIVPPAAGTDTVEAAAFVQALERLAGLDARTGDVVKLKLLWGLNNQEVAEALSVSVRTVEREWRFGRRWLAAELGGPEAP